MPNADATTATAATNPWKPLIRSGQAKRGSDAAAVELRFQRPFNWEVRLFVTISGVADEPLVVYAGDCSMLALALYNTTCRQIKSAGFRGRVAQSDGSELMDELQTYVLTPEALGRVMVELGVPTGRGGRENESDHTAA